MQEQLERKAKQELLDIGDGEWDKNDFDEYNNIKDNQYEAIDKKEQESKNKLQSYYLSNPLKRRLQKKENTSLQNMGVSLKEGLLCEQRKFNDKKIEKKINGLNIEKKEKIYKTVCKNNSQVLQSQSRNISEIQSNVDVNKQTYTEKLKQSKPMNKEEVLQRVNQISSSSYNFKQLSINAMQNEYIPYQKHLTWIYNKDKTSSNSNLNNQQPIQTQIQNYELREIQPITQQQKTQMLFKNICYQNNPQLFYLVKSAKEREVDLQLQAKDKLSSIQWNLSNNSSQLLSDIISNNIQEPQSKNLQIPNIQKQTQENTNNQSNLDIQLSRKSTRKSSSLLEEDLQKTRLTQMKQDTRQINQKLSKSISKIYQQSTFFQNNQQSFQQEFKKESSPTPEKVLNNINLETQKMKQKIEQQIIQKQQQLTQQQQNFSSYLNQKHSNQFNNIQQNEKDSSSQTPLKTQQSRQRTPQCQQNNKQQFNQNQYKVQNQQYLETENQNISSTLPIKIATQEDEVKDLTTKGSQILYSEQGLMTKSQETERLQNFSKQKYNEKQSLSKIPNPIQSISVSNINLLQNFTDRQTEKYKIPDFPNKRRQFSLIIPSSKSKIPKKAMTPNKQLSRRPSPVNLTEFPKIDYQDKREYAQTKKYSKFFNDQQVENSKDNDKEFASNNVSFKNYKVPSALYKTQKVCAQNVSFDIKQNEKQQSEKQQLLNNILIQNIQSNSNPIEKLKQFKSIVESTQNKKQNLSNIQKSTYIKQNIYTTFARQQSLNKFIYSK